MPVARHSVEWNIVVPPMHTLAFFTMKVTTILVDQRATKCLLPWIARKSHGSVMWAITCALLKLFDVSDGANVRKTKVPLVAVKQSLAGEPQQLRAFNRMFRTLHWKTRETAPTLEVFQAVQDAIDRTIEHQAAVDAVFAGVLVFYAQRGYYLSAPARTFRWLDVCLRMPNDDSFLGTEVGADGVTRGGNAHGNALMRAGLTLLTRGVRLQQPVWPYPPVGVMWITNMHMLGNGCLHDIKIDGVTYASVEHYYHSMKFEGTRVWDLIRCSSSPAEAIRLGRRKHVGVVFDEEKWEHSKMLVMARAVNEKFKSPQLLEQLLHTVGHQLVYRSTKDSVWGDGGDGGTGTVGQNKLGRLLMRLRDAKRAQLHTCYV